jgi:hypothetical protein
MEQKTVSRAVNETREYGIGGIGGSGIWLNEIYRVDAFRVGFSI